ncbi:unnamed protein product [Rotaria socialis]|uniref:RNA helicase n=1 Tax=Rotaria socialis TaxID=392032 RepID=A0A820A695_9BILA|nr:unnamed protein product [Rotaria socialis]CAF4183510.1 unnamed protein product [Rotaria socialis]
MTSATINDNLTQLAQNQSFAVSEAGLTAQLASLATASEPNNFSSNSQQSPVATFPQRTVSGPSSNNTESPFGNAFTSGQAQGFSFKNTSSTEHSGYNFSTASSGNVQKFSFTNSSLGDGPFTFNESPANAPAHQPIPSFTFTPTKQHQDMPNNKLQTPSSHQNSRQGPPTNEAPRMTQNNMPAVSRKPPSPTTPIAQQPSFLNQEQEAPDLPMSLADASKLGKMLNTTLRDSSALVVDRNDPKSPLYSLKSFEELDLKSELLKGIYSMGFQTPSRIQEITLPQLLSNPPRNLIAQSQSGTGKTAAFSLAILSRIDPSMSIPQALILSPTFELALQIGSVIERMAQYLPYISIAYAVRSSPTLSSTNLVRGQLLPQPIVIGTPGTVEDWCRRRRIIDLSKLRMCCVDEADVMIATEGFQQTCVGLVKGLNPACQMMLFSATYSDEVMTFAREIVTQPIVLRLKREKQALNNIRQLFIRCDNPEQKFYAIEQIYSHLVLGQAMFFCRTKATARALAIRMSNEQHSVRELTAALDIEQRASVIRQFRERVFNVLISTNVTARGIDIDDVSLVVNYDMPVTMGGKPDFETYLHRIGRCGRFGKLGYTFNLISSDQDFNTMKAIEEYFHHPINEITIEAIGNLEPDQT